MKKLFFSFITISICISSLAQSKRANCSKNELNYLSKINYLKGSTNLKISQIFFEDFQNGMPSNFTLIDNDGFTAYNPAFETKPWVIMQNDNLAGDSVAVSTSYYTAGGTISDDWMITPAITITPGCALSWDAKAFEAAYADGYEVKISTTGNLMANFTTNLFSIAAENVAWITRTVDLSAYNGQTIYIAFRNNSNDKNLLLIDDIQVYKKNQFDATICNSSYSPNSNYPIIPLSQVAPIYYRANAVNTGTDAVSAVQFDVNIPAKGFTATSNNNSALASNDTLFNMTHSNPLIITSPDTIKAHLMLTIPENETALSDNMDSITFVVSDTVMAKELGSYTEFLGIVENTGFMGQIFELQTKDTLTSVSFFLNEPTMGDSCKIQVWAIGSADTSLVASSENFVIPSDSASWYTLGIDGNSFVLNPNVKYIIGVRQSSLNTISLGGTKDYFTSESAFYKTDSSKWTKVETANYFISFSIRANFGIVRPMPNFDVAVKEVLGPNTSCNLTTGSITVLIKNYGINSISNFPIKMNVDGTIITETVSATISSLQSYYYTFTSMADLSSNGDHSIIVYTELTTDLNHFNDTANFSVRKLVPKTIPFSMGFEESEEIEGWVVVDENNDGSTWTPEYQSGAGNNSNGFAQYSYSTENDAKDVLVTTCISLESSKTYSLRFAYKAQSTNYLEKMKVYLMSGQNMSDTISKIVDLGEFSNTTYIVNSTNFNVPSSDIYYIGFMAYSNAEGVYIRLDNISISESTSINEDFNNQFQIFPNPTDDELNIMSNETIKNIRIKNALGQELIEQIVNSNKAKINTSLLKNGIYFLVINSENSVTTRKIIVE
ncbi:MAG: choice-of-anchor J domain-containing protein [Bacteroidota bacterium]